MLLQSHATTGVSQHPAVALHHVHPRRRAPCVPNPPSAADPQPWLPPTLGGCLVAPAGTWLLFPEDTTGQSTVCVCVGGFETRAWFSQEPGTLRLDGSQRDARLQAWHSAQGGRHRGEHQHFPSPQGKKGAKRGCDAPENPTKSEEREMAARAMVQG